MKRRQFIALGSAAAGSALLSPLAIAAEPHYVPYTPAAFAEAKAKGEPFLLDFFAPW